ncbi:MAG: hypothetical protein NT167_10565 [Verrucomicrobia bacterium]|nr:hypothetical protein [Verrucomicrobiota bacterium]
MTTTTNADRQPKPVPDGCQTGWNDSLPEVPSPASVAAAPDPLQASGLIPHPSTMNPQPTFPRLPGETPRAFSAFITWFQLGHSRSLEAVAEQLGEKHDTVKFWSSKYRWSERINAFNSGLLQQQAEMETAARCRQAADWSRRTDEYREQEWAVAQKLLLAAHCFLENLGDREVEKMSLAQVSRALEIYARLARHSLTNPSVSDTPPLAPLQVELAAALKKAFGSPAPANPQN